MNLRDHDKPCEHPYVSLEDGHSDGHGYWERHRIADDRWCPGGEAVTPDMEAAVTYHNTMRDSLTDSEDHRNHAKNVARHALGLPLGEVTGQIEDYHEKFLADAALGISDG